VDLAIEERPEPFLLLLSSRSGRTSMFRCPALLKTSGAMRLRLYDSIAARTRLRAPARTRFRQE